MFKEDHFSPLLFSFINKHQFNKNNLNQINHYGVTPLTLAIEYNFIEIVIELLKLGTNPFIENIHGNTPLMLSKQRSEFLTILKPSIKQKTCAILKCIVNAEFSYNNQVYRISKILNAGSCSIAAIEVINIATLKKYFVKIKPKELKFGGLEIRNYISLELYVDLFIIETLNLYSNNNNQNKLLQPDYHIATGTSIDLTTNKLVQTVQNSYGLMQKIIPGIQLGKTLTFLPTFEQKKLAITSAITSLCKFHQTGYIHNDALPNNFHWNNEDQTTTLIDFDVARTKEDLNKEQKNVINAQFNDLCRLIMGEPLGQDGRIIYGLMHYITSCGMQKIIEDFDEGLLDRSVKQKLLIKLL